MIANATVSDSVTWRRMRWVVWGGAALMLLLPAIAMRFSTEVDWDRTDFVIMGIMLGSVCGAFELALRMARSHASGGADGIAVAAGFMMTWINLAVGIIGDENNPANLMFFGVLAIGFSAVLFARLEPLGMARAMEVTAIAQVVVCIAALLLGEGYVAVLTGFFVVMWLLSAHLFRKAAGQQMAAGP